MPKGPGTYGSKMGRPPKKKKKGSKKKENSKTAKKKKESEQRELDETSPVAVRKLELKQRDVNGITVKEIKAILMKVYTVTLSGSKLNKSDFVRALEKEMANDLSKYEALVFCCGVRCCVGPERRCFHLQGPNPKNSGL